MVEVEDENFNSFMEGEFTGTILKQSVINRIAEINNIEHPIYPERVHNYYLSLLNYADNNVGEEDRAVLDMQYREMMAELGLAFRLEQLTAEENYPDLSEIINEVIEIQKIIFQYHIDEGNRPQAISYGMDKAQTYRLASRRDFAIVALQDLATYTVSSEELNPINEFKCRIGIEQDLLENEISIVEADLPALIEACSSSNLRIRTSPTNKESSNNSISIKPNPASTTLMINSNLENFHLNIYTVLGHSILTKEVNFNVEIDVSSFKKGLYTLTIEKDDLIIESKKISIQ